MTSPVCDKRTLTSLIESFSHTSNAADACAAVLAVFGARALDVTVRRETRACHVAGSDVLC